MISLSIFKQMENDKDGAVLEYTTDYGTSWKRIGNEDEGIEWYNSNNVNSNPGAGGTRGWTDTTSQWVEARHDLDFLTDKENVQFRIAFKADNSLNYEGLAFDNVQISNRTRTVLVEHFTNYESSTARTSDQYINSITTNLIHDAIDIQYQSSYSSNNSIYEAYQMGVTTRESYYGITAIPYAYFDGIKEFSFTNTSSTPDTIALMSRALTDPAFKIDLQTINDGSQITANISVEALKVMENRQLTILTAIVEKEISFDPGSGELILENVLRRFIPGPGGEYLDKNWSIGQTTSLNYSFNLPPYFEKGDSAIIITFIQDEISKEVLQAASDGASGLSSQTSIEDWFANSQGLNFMLFPNPATDKLYITFSQLPKTNAQLSIINQQGQTVKTYEPDATWYSNCDISSLESGIYFVQWMNGSQQVVKKLIIQH
jgi:hypothetical protein